MTVTDRMDKVLKEMHESAVCYAENGDTYCNTKLVQEMATIAESYYNDYRQAMSELRGKSKLFIAWHDHPSYQTFLGVFSSREKAQLRIDTDFRGEYDSCHLGIETVTIDKYYNEENE